MRLMNQSEWSGQFSNIHSFLDTFHRRWLKTFFIDKDEFIDFLDDEDIHILAYQNDQNELCCVVILCENSILTAVFSSEAEKEECYSSVLNDAESLVKGLHYTCIYYGAGDYSFGVYYNDENPFGVFLKENGFVIESVNYDIKYELSSLKQYSGSGDYTVRKADKDAFRHSEEFEHSDSFLCSIAENFHRFPSDTCYIAVRNRESDLLGYAFYDARSHVIDIIKIKEKKPAICKDIKKRILSAIAIESSLMGADSLIETNVDQLECQRITNPFEVCGRYESLVKMIG